MVKPEETPPRPWEFDDLLALGKRGGVTYLKAIPVLILHEWVKQGQGAQVYIRTKALERRLVESGLHRPFKSKGTSNILAALSSIQKDRNLTSPPLMKTKLRGGYWVNLEDYKHLLEEFRQYYLKEYPDDYRRLFPEGEPQWESQIIWEEPNEIRAAVSELEVQDETQSLLAPVAKVLRDQQRTIERLTEENRKLQGGPEAKTGDALEVSFVHTSPDFHRSEYSGKVTSIKDTIGGMLKRARRAIRISTRQMDMFTDDLIALKRRNPDIEITVLSRGPQGAEGDRKRLAGVAFERMKQAGIKLPVEKDTLHSRLIVIDTKEALVSSADLDFTHMDLEFNAGIWTSNPEVVAEAIRYFDNLLGLSQGS